MSTSIALQDLRERTLTHRHSTPISPSTQEYQDQDQGTNLTTRLDSPSPSHTFNPTKTFYITPHNHATKTIPIHDLTALLSTHTYTGITSTYKLRVQAALKDSTLYPSLTITRANFIGTRYTASDTQGNFVAEWTHPYLSIGTTTLSFPEGSEHSSHKIDMKVVHWLRRTEGFTIDSCPFVWEMDSLWCSKDMTLYKLRGEERVVVGKFASKWWGPFHTGGVLVVDEGEVDAVVVALSVCVVVRKRRQRWVERGCGGGGGP